MVPMIARTWHGVTPAEKADDEGTDPAWKADEEASAEAWKPALIKIRRVRTGV